MPLLTDMLGRQKFGYFAKIVKSYLRSQGWKLPICKVWGRAWSRGGLLRWGEERWLGNTVSPGSPEDKDPLQDTVWGRAARGWLHRDIWRLWGGLCCGPRMHFTWLSGNRRGSCGHALGCSQHHPPEDQGGARIAWNKNKRREDAECIILIAEMRMRDVWFQSTEKTWDTYCLNPLDFAKCDFLIEHLQLRGCIKN